MTGARGRRRTIVWWSKGTYYSALAGPSVGSPTESAPSFVGGADERDGRLRSHLRKYEMETTLGGFGLSEGTLWPNAYRSSELT